MNGIHCALTGRLPADAELKYTSTGKALLNFSLAVDDAKHKEGDATEWVRVTVWEEQAERLADRLKKGSEVYVEGRLKLNAWNTADGEQRTGLNVSAGTCEVLGAIGRKAPKRTIEPAEYSMAATATPWSGR